MKLDDCNAPYSRANQPGTLDIYENHELDSITQVIVFLWVYLALHALSAVWHGIRFALILCKRGCQCSY